MKTKWYSRFLPVPCQILSRYLLTCKTCSLSSSILFKKYSEFKKRDDPPWVFAFDNLHGLLHACPTCMSGKCNAVSRAAQNLNACVHGRSCRHIKSKLWMTCQIPRSPWSSLNYQGYFRMLSFRPMPAPFLGVCRNIKTRTQLQRTFMFSKINSWVN